jgi:hypothetical protein
MDTRNDLHKSGFRSYIGKLNSGDYWKELRLPSRRYGFPVSDNFLDLTRLHFPLNCGNLSHSHKVFRTRY